MEESQYIHVPVVSEPSKDPSKLVQPHNYAERCGEENMSYSFGIEPDGNLLRYPAPRWQQVWNYEQH